MPVPRLTWRAIEDLALALDERHPAVDPIAIRFTELRRMVEALPGFEEEPGHPVNEQILEAIQATWIEERSEGSGESDDDDDRDRGYRPASPFRPG